MGKPAFFAVAALVILFAGSASAAQPNGFHFEVPNGWLDLSRDTPDENLTKVMPSIREAATSKRADSNCVFYAAPPGEEAAVVATLRSEADSEPLDDDALGRARDQLGHGGVFRTEDARLKTSTASGGRGSPGEPARTARRVSSST